MSSYLKRNPSQSIRDITDDYYQELRKPKRVLFIVNGNRTFSGKLLSITPNRYFILNDLLNDLTKYFGSFIPTGVRRIYDTNGRHVLDIDDLEHCNIYICCGQESLKTLKYDNKYFELIKKGHLHNHNSHIKFYYNPQEYFDNTDSIISPQTPLFYRGNRLYPISTTPNVNGNNKSSPRSPMNRVEERTLKPLVNDSNKKNKPQILTIIRIGIKPYSFFKILLNKTSTQTYEDLLSDISDTFRSNWKGKSIRTIYNIDGMEIHQTSDFFRSGKYFVAIGDKDPSLNQTEVRNIVAELFPDYEKMSDPNADNNILFKDRNAKVNETEMTVPLTEEDYLYNSPDVSYRKTDVQPSVSNDNASIRLYHKSTQDSIPIKKRNWRKPKQQLVAPYYTEEYKSPGYPNNDSRKPGPFEMTPEEYTTSNLTPKMRAQIFGLERIRAGLEEREKARFLMAKKLDQQNHPRTFLNKYSPSNNRRPFPSKAFPEKYKYSPYLESFDVYRNDKENFQISKNPKSKRSQNGSDFEDNSPNQNANPHSKKVKKPDSDRNPIRSQKKDQTSVSRRNSDNRDKKKQPWERIPPINLGRFTPRNDLNENFYQLPDIRVSLPTVTEENGDNSTKDANEKQDPLFVEPSFPKYNIASEVNLLDTDKEKTGNPSISSAENTKQSLKEPKIEKSISDLKIKKGSSKSEIEKKLYLATMIGPRSETVNLFKKGKSFQKPTRTKKQSSVIQNPLAERIVPVLAQQLSTDEEFEKYYQLGDSIGTGNFSEVKEAKKKTTGKPFAAKIIDKKKLKDKEDLIEEEIRILKSCEHPNIVKLEEQFETPNKVFLVQEYIKGGDLFDAICENIKFSESQSAVMMRDIFRALLYIHSRGIVHRDIKPENLLCCIKNGVINLKLSDFGLAVEVKEPLYVICGTPTYVAPEILTEQGYGLEVDIWAAGVICYILLCGFPPFRSPERNQTELFEFIKAGEFEYLKPYWDNISPESKDLINNMLIVDPVKRFSVLDCLCHPWTITLGNSIRFTKPLMDIVTETRIELQMETAIFKSNNIINNNIS